MLRILRPCSSPQVVDSEALIFRQADLFENSRRNIFWLFENKFRQVTIMHPMERRIVGFTSPVEAGHGYDREGLAPRQPHGMALKTSQNSFDAVVLPHVDAAFNLARWLMRNSQDAEDVVQDSLVRALTYFSGYRGTNARGWFLQIVRNAAFASMKANRGIATVPFDESIEETGLPGPLIEPPDGPEESLVRAQDRMRLSGAITALPIELREVFVLREFEDLSYKEIAAITETPIGTVMSRLWRARRLLAGALVAEETGR